MKRRGSALVAAALAAVVAVGCGSSPGDDRPAARSTTVPTFGGVPGAAQRVACQESVRGLQQLSDLYEAANGAPAPSLDVVRSYGAAPDTPSPNAGYVLGYDPATGRVTATGACTGG